MSNIGTPPGLTLDNQTIGTFNASFSGVGSATTVPVAEPAGIALMGVGLLGLGVAHRRRQRSNMGGAMA